MGWRVAVHGLGHQGLVCLELGAAVCENVLDMLLKHLYVQSSVTSARV